MVKLGLKPLQIFDVPFVLVSIYIFFIIFSQHQEVVYDQGFVLRGLQPFSSGWPIYDSGIVSNIIVYLIGGIFHPSPENINGVVRGIASLSLLKSFYLLIREFVDSVILRYLGLGILVFSGYPFLWVSTEIFAASFLLLFLFAWLKECSPVTIAIFGALFSLCRPDLPLMTFALGLLVVLKSKKPWQFGSKFILTGVILFCLFNLPGVITNGGENHFLNNRAGMSTFQHFAVMASKFQRQQPALEPWENWQVYKTDILPKANSIKDFISQYGDTYLLFVSANIGILFFMLIHVMHLTLVPWGITFFSHAKFKSFELPLKKTYLFLCTSFVGFIPMLLLASPHQRYLTRFYVLFLIFALMYVGQFKYKKNKRLVSAIYVVIFALFFYNQGRDTWRALTHPGHYEKFWFSD